MRLVIARCSVDYVGRLTAHLPSALRLLIVKADGSVLVHSDGGSYKPLNWMSPPCRLTERPGQWIVTGKSGESLEITITEVISDTSVDLGTDPGLVKDGVEAHLQELLAEQVELLGDGWRLVRREYPTPIGPVDLMCRDDAGRSVAVEIDSGGGAHVAVEVKRVAGIDAVEQLTRYLELLNRDPLLRPVKGVLAAQSIRPQARTLAEDRGIRCVVLDYDAMRGIEREGTLFLSGRRASGSGIRQDGVMPESRRPAVDMGALAAWCRRWLGAPPAAELFEAGYLSTVTGLRLADGREVVVKVRPGQPRLAGCAAVHRALWAAGFPCPEPLVDLQPLGGYAASAEVLVPDADQAPPHSELARLSAAGLARLVELAPDPGSVPDLAPSPSYAGWDHTESGLWPAPEDRDVDLNAYPEPRWLGRVAAAVRDELRGHRGDPVIGHGDWHPENLRWHGPRLVAVHDWDSVIGQPEPAIAGLAAASFLGIDGPAPLADVQDSAAFLDAYQQARGRRWTSGDYAACWAAGLWQRAFDAKTRSLDGDPEEILPRPEARARLRLAGLNPDLAGSLG